MCDGNEGMIILPGYKNIETIDSNSLWNFYRGYTKDTEQRVLIKTIRKVHAPVYPASADQREYTKTIGLSIDGVMKPLLSIKQGRSSFLIFPDFNGISLRSVINKQTIAIREVLIVAVNLANTLRLLHDHHLVHKELNPDNILINTDNWSISLTGFYNSERIDIDTVRNDIPSIHLSGGYYISPELTGKMNRNFDARSDLYSFGIILYELLTGKKPFQSENISDLVYLHLTKIPAEPRMLNKKLPPTLNKIIMKLLQKEPERRYQSAFGLWSDLSECLNQINNSNQIVPFTIGGSDLLILSEKLYGQEKALAQLNNTLSSALSSTRELVLVSGASGSGKTALVDTFRNRTNSQTSFFINGKYDQIEQPVPYGPIVDAFKVLVKQILSEGVQETERWKIRITAALGTSASVLAAVLPELTWIIGNQPPSEPLNAMESQTRFFTAMQNFINLFLELEKAMVIFIDDIQWADMASLDLIRHLLGNLRSGKLLLICAYRNDEDAVYPGLQNAIKKLKSTRTPITEILLDPLNEPTISRWLSAKFNKSEQEIFELTSSIFRISRGNPFFIKQILISMSFMKTGQINIGNLTKMTEQSLGEKILNFMVDKLQSLNDEMQKVLKTAASLGSEFQLSFLTEYFSDFDDTALSKHLWKAVLEGLVIPMEGVATEAKLLELIQNKRRDVSFRFMHDRIQHAVYSMMSEKEQLAVHLRIGKLLKHKSTTLNGSTHLYDLVRHLNISKSLLNDQDRMELVELNALAGKTAKDSAAFSEALFYFKTSKEMLPINGRGKYQDLTYRIYLGLGECQYLNRLFLEADSTFDEILSFCQTGEEKLEIYHLKITLYTHLHRIEEAVDAGISALNLFGWNLKKNPGKFAVAKELCLTQLAAINKKPDQLLQLPAMKDRESKLILKTLIKLNAPAYHVNQNLATILMLRAFRFILKHGDTELSALVYNNYALILSAGFGNYKKSYQYGNLAHMHVKRSGTGSLKGRVNFVFGSFVNHWKKPLSTNLDFLLQSQQDCLEAGNMHLAGAASSFIVITRLLMGEQLERAILGVKDQLQFVHDINYPISVGFLKELESWLDILTGKKTADQWVLPDVKDDKSALIIHYTVRLQMAFLFKNQQLASELLEHLEKLVDKTLVLVIAPEYCFYSTLWYCRFSKNASKPEQIRLRKKIRRNIRHMKKWAESCPANYKHKHLLMRAEELTLSGKDPMLLYEAAIKTAFENGFQQDEAIANECAAIYYSAKSMDKLAALYLLEAYDKFNNWGACSKVNQLEYEYPEILSKDAGLARTLLNAEKTAEVVDFESLMDAARAITKEVRLDQLTNKMMEILMRNAGAESGYLFLKHEDKLTLAVKGTIQSGIIPGNMEVPEEVKDSLSSKAIHIVAASREALLLDDAANHGLLANDDYINGKKVKSLLCFPILQQQELLGIVYLENNMTSHAFTQDSINILSILSAQAAIAIQNAGLFQNLEEVVKERTSQLESANHELAKAEQLRSEFLSNISHDLRTPITSIKGYIEAILDGVVNSPDQQKQYLERTRDRITALNRLIHDLFELSKLEAGTVRFKTEPVSADKLFQYLSNQYELVVRNASLDYKTIIDDSNDVFPMVEVDVGRIDQVLYNLISNSLKFTLSGSITIQLSFDYDSGFVIFTVCDTGIGIEQEEAEAIFNRSYTKRRNGAAEGNGLGLSICREIISYHNGEIWAESIPGKGTSIVFTIPILALEESFESELKLLQEQN